MVRIFILLLAASPVLAQGQYILGLHENPRVMAMGGAFVSVADDPQTGHLNPAGLREVKLLGMDLSFSSATGQTPDQIAFALLNPGSDAGAAFGTGYVEQGLLNGEKVKYHVPYTGAGYRVWGGGDIGLGIRFPYRSSKIDSIRSRWEAIGDLSALQRISTGQIGAQVERMFGGAADMVPRRLRVGASFGRPGQFVLAYEWRGIEGQSEFDFHWESSHVGGEFVSQYVALRGGYVWDEHWRFVSAGLAFGLLESGWRLEAGWQIPTVKHTETRWSVGFGYRG